MNLVARRARIVSILALLGAAIVVPSTNASAADRDAGAPSSVPACVQVSTSSRYVPYGYNHVVTLTNGCTRAASCVVATDVNPERQSANVPAGSSHELVTFMGSPSATFVARVSCQLR